MSDRLPPAAPTGASRWQTVALAISVSINLLVAGMVLGQYMSGHHGGWGNGDHGGANHPSPFDIFTKTAPPEVQPVLRDAIATYQPTALMYLNEIREARRAAVAQLRHRPFDQGATAAAFATLRDRIFAAQTSLQNMAIAAYAQGAGSTGTTAHDAPAQPQDQPPRPQR